MMQRFFFWCVTFILLSAGHADAQTPLGRNHDNKAPIEISSDSLEVLQQDNKAIFKGNVVAVQADMRLKSDVMIVHYKKQDDAAAAKPKTDSDPTKGAMGAITRIEVEGNVLVATPEESAKGDRGNYDVDNHLIHLLGDNVTLTRGKNILKGTALEYNLVTGRSLLTNGADVVSGKSGNGRVRGVFVPNEEPKGK